jgi:phage/plasmid-like protein (TIGR03299 family)
MAPSAEIDREVHPMSDYFESGFCVREPSWHGKELLLAEGQRPQSWEEGRKLAGLEWDWEVDDLYQREVLVKDGGPVEEFTAVSGFQIITRSDNHEVLHAAKQSYKIITIKEMGEIAHAVTDLTQLPMETMGSVRGGKSVYGLAVLGPDRWIGKDPSATRPYLGVVNHADGTGACRAYPTSIRIVCANTLGAADAVANTENTVAVFRHAGDWRDHIEAAREAVFGARKAFDKWTEIAEQLQEIYISETQAEQFVRTFIPEPANTEFATERVMKNINRERTKLRGALNSVTSDGIQETAYWLVQAGAEYLDHLRPYKGQDSYVSRTLIDVNKGKGLATKFALEIAGRKDLFRELQAELASV